MKKIIFLAAAITALTLPLTAQHDYDSQGIIYSFPSLPGNVGIGGMPNPSYTLEVHGVINASGLSINGSTLIGSQWSKSGNNLSYTLGNVGIGGAANASYKLDVNGTINATNILINGAPLPGSMWSETSNNLSYLAGNVGVGYASSDDFQLTVKSSLQGNTYYSGQDIILDPGIVPFRMIAQDYDPSGGGFQPNRESIAEAYVFGYNETVSQSAKVYSLRKDGALILGETSNSQSAGLSYSIVSDNSIFSRSNVIADNRIGIGTTSPADAIDVRNGNVLLNTNILLLKGPSELNHSLQWKYTFASETIDGPILQGWAGGALATGSGGEKAVLTWLSSGHVGIGTSTPTTELEVNGWVKFDGSNSDDEIQFESQSGFHRIAFHQINFYDWDTNTDMLALNDGNVGIGTTSPSEALEVVGTIKSIAGVEDNALLVQNSSSNGIDFVVKGDGRVFAREVEVTLTAFPDYVFGEEYDLMSLSQLRKYISTEKHLPGIKSAAEVEEEGIGLGELAKVQLEKIEELTLYILQLEERIAKLESSVK